MRAKALEGDLSEFPLTDIIQLVDLSKKTGAVHIQGQRGIQRMEGWLYFRDGKIIGAELPGMAPMEAVYTFFTFSAGPFRFYDDVLLEHPTITTSNEVIIMEGIMRQDAWATIQEQVPSLMMIPRLVPNPSSGTTEINLEAEEWRVLTMVNGKNSVAQIAQRSGLGEFRTCEIIAELLKSGLIEERETNPAERLLPELETIIANAVGAGAGTITQDAFQQAEIDDPTSVTEEQALQVVGYLEQSLTNLLDAEQSRAVSAELRARVRELLA
ncbi:MAG: DUF4388 domain-containing protein [Chloroflexaceae bacterium]|nr:DUF4388 domain-containing protein [Chloroflexaceae bacterium]NJL34563.1 DUF4388 domain-containing protein [Chloroflexaceae bacterium]NJO05739.1 DUF4388 domain-containing protein [Chloroflexaceae bacterium]